MLIRVSDCQQVAWKNGGGATREIAVFPPGAGIADFTWRLSSARVEKPGAFSRFDGIDRTIAILKGTLLLEVEGQVPRHLTSHSPPYAFPGHLATSGAPVGGEVLDLNLMVRRGAGCARMRIIPAGPVEMFTGVSFICPARKPCSSLEIGKS